MLETHSSFHPTTKRMIDARRIIFSQEVDITQFQSKTRTHRKNRSKVGNGSLISAFSERRKREEITGEEEKKKRKKRKKKKKKKEEALASIYDQ